MNKYYAEKKEVFDINKVTVVGSPTITSGGIASGFSSGNYLRISNVDLSKPFKIREKFKTGTLYSQYFYGSPLSLTNQGGWYNYLNALDTAIQFVLKFSDGSTPSPTAFIVQTSIQANTEYEYELSWNGSEYTLKLYKDDIQLGSTGTYTSSLSLYNANNCNILLGVMDYTKSEYPFTGGSIDLTAFKIYVDGELVYSPTKPTYYLERRKEGFDLSKFKVVGSPTITTDGIASGFTTNDYLLGNAHFDISNTDSWKLNGEFTTGADIATAQYPFSLYDVDGDYSIGICIQNSKYYFSISDNEGVLVNSASANPPIIANTKYFYEITYNSEEGYKCYLSQDVNNQNLIAVSTNTRKMNYGETSIKFGRTGIFSPRPFAGSIDLTAFEIYVDGVEVFTGAKEKFYAMRGGM